MDENLKLIKAQPVHIGQIKNQLSSAQYDLQQNIFHHIDLMKKLETSAFSVVAINEKNGGEIVGFMILDHICHRYIHQDIWETLRKQSRGNSNSFNSVLIEYLVFPSYFKDSIKSFNEDQQANSRLKLIEERSCEESRQFETQTENFDIEKKQ